MNKYPVGVKLRILFTYAKLVFISLTWAKIANTKKARVLGFVVEAFDYWTLQYLFGEIFVRSEYYFSSKSKKPIIMDCGSNIGMSILFFKFLFPDSVIHGFEPDPVTFALLDKNIKSNNLSGVHLHNVAVSDREEEISFYTDETPGSLLMSVIKGRMSSKEIKIPTIRFVDFIADYKVNFLKIDIEGHENVVFADLAASKALSKIDEMIIEYHHNITGEKSKLSGFLSLLEQSGFNYQIDGSTVPIYTKKFQDILIYAYGGKSSD